MAPTLEQARAAARRQDWFAILGLSFPVSERDVLKAKRQLQRTAHQDRGGSAELSQLINLAADELIDLLRPEIRERRERHDHEDETRRRKDEELRRLKEEELRRHEDARRREEDYERRKEEGRRILEEQCRAERMHSLSETVRVAHCRGGSKRTTANLSFHAGRAFPVAKKRVQALRKRQGGTAKACALVYAIEREIAARRAAREDKWPKTVGLERRQPDKKEALAAQKREYDRAYQQLRHLRRTGQLHAHASLTTQRLLREAWMILLDLPAPRQCDETNVIPLGAQSEAVPRVPGE